MMPSGSHEAARHINLLADSLMGIRVKTVSAENRPLNVLQIGGASPALSGSPALSSRCGPRSLCARNSQPASIAAIMWAAYILLARATGKHFAGLGGLSIATTIAGAVTVLPALLTVPRTALFSAEVLGAGLALALLSSALPYAL